MKKTAMGIVAAVLFTVGVSAQQRVGNFLGSGTGRPPTTAEQYAEQQDLITRQLGGHALRRIRGEVHNLRLEGESIQCKVVATIDDTVIVEPAYDRFVCLTNCKGAELFGRVNVRALKVGASFYNQKTIDLFDCGALLTPEEEKQRQQEFESAQIKAQQDRIAASKLKAFIAESNEVARLKVSATNGSASAQYSLALRYLEGRGCKQDKAAAIQWLRAASDAGYSGASNKLESVLLK